MITVDDNSHNELIWKKQEEIVSYNIYREGMQSGNYELVANIGYNAENRWVDMASNAKIRSYRYKVSALDTCGTESELSSAHRTMHLTINAGQNNSWNLIWTAYEGTDYSTYYIYRAKGNANGPGTFEMIGSMPAGNTSYSDFSVQGGGFVYYIVEIILNENCNTGKTSFSIKSNMATDNPGVGIEEKWDAASLQIYPNPTTGELRIENGELRIENVEVFDVYGRKLKGEGKKEKGEKEFLIDISDLATGVYFLRIMTEQGETVRKVVKE